jgi:hypothetical protein
MNTNRAYTRYNLLANRLANRLYRVYVVTTRITNLFIYLSTWFANKNIHSFSVKIANLHSQRDTEAMPEASPRCTERLSSIPVTAFKHHH